MAGIFYVVISDSVLAQNTVLIGAPKFEAIVPLGEIASEQVTEIIKMEDQRAVVAETIFPNRETSARPDHVVRERFDGLEALDAISSGKGRLRFAIGE